MEVKRGGKAQGGDTWLYLGVVVFRLRVCVCVRVSAVSASISL